MLSTYASYQHLPQLPASNIMAHDWTKESRASQMDIHYTPRLLANQIVASAADLRPSVVADLCAGRGDLLLEAHDAWPHADYAAVDIDHQSVQRLRRAHPAWHVGRCDLTNPLSRAHSPVLRRFSQRISLLLLNPPFTCRGGTRLIATPPGRQIYTSTAMFFLVTSLTYLHPSGSAVAILPAGVLHSQKDRPAWSHITDRYNVSIVDKPQPRAFPRSSATTAIVRISPNKPSPNRQRANLPPVPPIRRRLTVQLTRGCQPMFRARHHSTGPTLVHSTDLRDATVILNGRRGLNAQRSISGPAVLLPRVGQITKPKIAIMRHTTPVVLSDCVIALATSTLNDAQELRRRLLFHFSTLSAQYVGTGAPFITTNRLADALLSLGVHVDVT